LFYQDKKQLALLYHFKDYEWTKIPKDFFEQKKLIQ